MMNSPRPVLTKRDFVRRYQAGEFGNRAPTWDTFEEYWDSDYPGLMHIRNRIAGGPTFYDIPRRRMSEQWKWTQSMYPSWDFYFSAMCPTSCTLFQGEVCRLPTGLDLYCSRVPKPMRDSLRVGGRRYSGILALSHLTYFLETPSLEWLQHLLDTYPDHVVEFTALSCHWGTVLGHNTIFWEVRKY